MGRAHPVDAAPFGHAHQVNMFGVDECRNHVARDNEVVRTLPRLLQPDEYKPLVVIAALAGSQGGLSAARQDVRCPRAPCITMGAFRDFAGIGGRDQIASLQPNMTWLVRR
jgi:hypothetical protein